MGVINFTNRNQTIYQYCNRICTKIWEMVEYCEEAEEDSKTKYFNPTGCGALTFFLETTPVSTQYRLARCRSRVSAFASHETPTTRGRYMIL